MAEDIANSLYDQENFSLQVKELDITLMLKLDIKYYSIALIYSLLNLFRFRTSLDNVWCSNKSSSFPSLILQ